MSYLSVDLNRCRNLKHKLRSVWSDKTPQKVSLLCETESVDGHSAYVAYGIDTLGFGAWGSKPKREDSEQHDT